VLTYGQLDDMVTRLVFGLSSGKLIKLRGRENDTFWAQQMQYQVRESEVWDVVRGKELKSLLVSPRQQGIEFAELVIEEGAVTTLRRYSDIDNF
jgi:hypothetical protein